MSKAIVFDLDGTLVDSAPDLMDAHNYVMQKFGYHQKPLTDIRHLAGRGAANMILSSLKEEEKKFRTESNNLHKYVKEKIKEYYKKENILYEDELGMYCLAPIEISEKDLEDMIKLCCPFSYENFMLSKEDFNRLPLKALSHS